MTTNRIIRFLLIVVSLGALLLAGCASYIRPELGAVAQPEARIDLVGDGVENAAWQSKDLTLTYSYAQSADIFTFSGSLSFHRSLTDSFGVAKTFSLKMSFLDKDGRVLETADITPLFSSFGTVPDRLPVQLSLPRPAAASALAFNYFGVFRSGHQADMGGDEWEIFYFPYNR